jgi:hypothetical protein
MAKFVNHIGKACQTHSHKRPKTPRVLARVFVLANSLFCRGAGQGDTNDRFYPVLHPNILCDASNKLGSCISTRLPETVEVLRQYRSSRSTMRQVVHLILITVALNFYGLNAKANCISPTIVVSPDDNCESSHYGGTPQIPDPPQYAFERLHWYEYSRYVQSYTNVYLSDDGTWTIRTLFSNGHKTAKRTMGISVAIVTEEGECLFGAVHEVNLDPAFFGSANEYTSTSTGNIRPEEVNLVHDTRFSASVVTSHVIAAFNQVRPYGQSLPGGQARACP